MRTLLRVAAIVAVAAIAWWLWPEGPEHRIRKRLEVLAKACSWGPGENVFAKQRALASIREALHPDLRVQVALHQLAPVEMTGRAAILEEVQKVRFGVEQLAVDFLDVRVSLEEGRTRAAVLCTLRVSQGKEQEHQEIRLSMDLGADGWQITRAETIRAFER